MKHITFFPLFLLIVANSTSAQDSVTTRNMAIACVTLTGLEDFWSGVDKLPAGVSQGDFIDSLGCARLREGLPFVPLQNVSGIVLAVRGQVWIDGEQFQVWLSKTDVK